jgi:hypothetical protein
MAAVKGGEFADYEPAVEGLGILVKGGHVGLNPKAKIRRPKEIRNPI